MGTETGQGQRPSEVGAGDYVLTDTTNDEAQWRYLLVVRRCVPAALEKLADIARRPENRVRAILQPGPRNLVFLVIGDRAIEQARDSVDLWREHPTFPGESHTFSGGPGGLIPDFPWSSMESVHESESKVS
jgi:hypothetical protein